MSPAPDGAPPDSVLHKDAALLDLPVTPDKAVAVETAPSFDASKPVDLKPVDLKPVDLLKQADLPTPVDAALPVDTIPAPDKALKKCQLWANWTCYGLAGQDSGVIGCGAQCGSHVLTCMGSGCSCGSKICSSSGSVPGCNVCASVVQSGCCP